MSFEVFTFANFSVCKELKGAWASGVFVNGSSYSKGKLSMSMRENL